MKAVCREATSHYSFITVLARGFLVGMLLLGSLITQAETVAPPAATVAVEAVEEVAEVEAAAGEVTPAKKQVTQKSPSVFSMQTKILARALVQDLVRVGERIFLAGERGHIGWSDDNGVTWQQAKVPTIQDINALYFVTQELGWAVGHDGNIFNTTDGGKTWVMQLDGLAYNLVRAQAKVEKFNVQLTAKQDALAQAEEELEAAQVAGKKKTEKLEAVVDELQEVVDELEFQIRDARKILDDENAPWPLMDVWFSDINNGFAVGAFNAFLMTNDGGKSWRDASDLLSNPDGLHLNVVAGNAATVLIGGEGGLLFRSRDAGVTWESLESPDDGSFYAMNITRNGDPNALDIWAVGMEGSVFHSTDAGNSWEQIEHDINYNLNGIWTDDQGLILIVGNDGALLRSTDSGKTFEGHNRFDQVTMSSVVVAANGNYVMAGATGIMTIKPDEWNAKE